MTSAKQDIVKTSTGHFSLLARSLAIIFIAGLALIGCRGTQSEDPPVHLNPNMDTQNKYKSQAESDFFADGAAMRMPPEGTVARGQLREDDGYFRGKQPDGSFVESIPFEVTPAVLVRGAERYDIFCAPCHGPLGDGRGKIMEYKYPVPPTSFYHERVMAMNDGNLFDIISNGIRNMPSYRQQIPVEDRWSIVAHVREIQKRTPPPPPEKTTEQMETDTEASTGAGAPSRDNATDEKATDQQQAGTE